jgi:hypothetical protein
MVVLMISDGLVVDGSMGLSSFTLTFLVVVGGDLLDKPDFVVDDGHDGQSDEVHELKSEGHSYPIIIKLLIFTKQEFIKNSCGG